MSHIRTRFAPSPTGFLHLGTLRTALYTYMLAKHSGGTFILRIEDTDQEREVPGATEAIYRAMRTAGLEWDEGPDIGGSFGPYTQTLRKPLYMPYVMQLVEAGHAYPCFCTVETLEAKRQAAAANKEVFKYDKHCMSIPPEEARRRMDSGEPFVIRQNIPAEGKAGFHDELYGYIEVDCATLDDNILIKADGLPTYNFANVIDDHLMEITHVMRGNEYLQSAPKYELLYKAFGWTPPKYIHLTNIMANATRKLSKRLGDPSFEDLLEMGYLKDAIVNYIPLLGWSPGDDREFFTLEELVAAFDIKGISKSNAIFDIGKLNWFNTEYIKRLPFEEFMRLATPWLDKALPAGKYDYTLLCSLLHTRTEVFSALPAMVSFLEQPDDITPEKYTNKKQKAAYADAPRVLDAVIDALNALPEFSQDAIHAALMALPSQLGMKTGQALWPVRIALTGRESTPGGAIEIAALLGRDETMKRLEEARSAMG